MKITNGRIFLLVILLIALAIRVFYAANIEFGPDEINYFARAINFFAVPHLSTIDHPPLYFYLVDISYKIFSGVNWWSARSVGVLLGTLSVFLVYLIGCKSFGERIGLTASFFLAISSFQAKYSGIGTIDVVPTFFVLLSMYFFLKRDENGLFLSACFGALALAVLSKYSALLLLPALIVWIFFEERRLFFEKKLWLGCALFLLLLSPLLAYNLLLYEKEGILDFQLTRIFKTPSEKFENLAGIDEDFELTKLPGGILSSLRLFAFFFPLIFLFALTWASSNLSDKNSRLTILFASFIILFYSSIGFQSFYYQLLVPFLCLFAGASVLELVEESKQKISIKKALAIILFVFVSVEFFIAYNDFNSLEKNATIQLREHVRNIPGDVLVIVDNKIYSGRMAWAFHDRHYVSVVDDEYIKMAEDSPGDKQATHLFFVECAKYNCGWMEGIVRESIERESILLHFKNLSVSTHTIFEGGAPAYIVKDLGIFQMNPNVLIAADTTHRNYFYPVGWEDEKDYVDKFQLEGNVERAAYYVGAAIVYFAVACAFASIIYLLAKLVSFFYVLPD